MTYLEHTWQYFAMIENSLSRRQTKHVLGIYLAAAILSTLPPADSAPREFSLGTEHTNDFRPASIIACPKPEIPADLHEQCFKSCCIARFLIDSNGQSRVKLLSSTGDEDLDDIALKTLRHWKFKPATLNGEPVSSTRRIKIEFEVE